MGFVNPFSSVIEDLKTLQQKTAALAEELKNKTTETAHTVSQTTVHEYHKAVTKGAKVIDILKN